MPQATPPFLRALLLFIALFACSAQAGAASYVVKHCAELEGQMGDATVGAQARQAVHRQAGPRVASCSMW